MKILITFFIGPEIAENLIQYFKYPEVQKQLKAFLKYITPGSPSSLFKQGSIHYKTFILTGTLSNLTCSQAIKLIQNQGERITFQISQKTSD